MPARHRAFDTQKKKENQLFSVTHRGATEQQRVRFRSVRAQSKISREAEPSAKTLKEEPRRNSRNLLREAKKKENCWLLLKKKTGTGPKSGEKAASVPKTGEKSLTARIFRVVFIYLTFFFAVVESLLRRPSMRTTGNLVRRTELINSD